MRRARVVVVFAVLGAMLLTAIGTAVFYGLRIAEETERRPPAPVTPTVEPGAADAPDPALARFYRQEVDWQPCRGGDLWCTTVTVPLDYERPRARTIDLALLKSPALEPAERVGSLVVNPGGPGAPGTDYAAQAKLVFRDPLLDAFDIVGFDPRGTGASAPVDCLSDGELDGFLAADPSPDTAAERAAAVDWVERLGTGCLARSGDLAAHVTTVEAARDMDVIRAVLGEAELDYLGASYGTKLGATYAELFPDRVGRFVLDGGVDLALDFRQLSLEQAAGFEVALRAYVQDCVDSGDCFLGDSVEQGLTRISAFIDEVDAQPLPTSSKRDLAVGNAFYGVVAPLYNRDYWFLLDTALEAAFEGDGTGLLELSDLYASRGQRGYTDNSSEAIYAISCLDDPSSIAPARVPAALPDFEEASPTFGAVFAWGLIGCLGQEAQASVPDLEVRAEGAAPIVVVGTTRDPATPYDWSVSLADQLASGVLVTRDGDGHTAYNSGNECIDEALEAYLLTGDVPDDGLTC